ncbi:hypothetical protein F5146DRAFT_999966 [Armillaria mellea]|nr:hypothetical protein F5146DRAFT_999966 [Armillaria mellea]
MAFIPLFRIVWFFVTRGRQWACKHKSTEGALFHHLRSPNCFGGEPSSQERHRTGVLARRQEEWKELLVFKKESVKIRLFIGMREQPDILDPSIDSFSILVEGLGSDDKTALSIHPDIERALKFNFFLYGACHDPRQYRASNTSMKTRLSLIKELGFRAVNRII